ncbi:cAMP-responsive element-binding protein-like 2 [Sinocyclocheilus grahami]|uniref:cAMP-responsive element-binding protein-like 2 n=1 Tax=Sinocyclocheilus grahami TaxID=75366 RepID=UPI0007ACA0AB|nr:PREDICTED: cAMP-responsive element-binding protein-like 2 [Sinocyclocheilus grahami]
MVAGKVKKPGKRGRKPAKIDLKAKLERSRQSARECRARKKLRYQYLEELVSSKERAICALREELDMVITLSNWGVVQKAGYVTYPGMSRGNSVVTTLGGIGMKF